MSAGNKQIHPPRPPEPRTAHRFPLVATLAPVVVSGALFAFTSSPFVLLFAVLGPVIAVASLVDSRWHAVQHLRAETVRFRRELLRAYEEVEREHERERYRRDQIAPSAGALITRCSVPRSTVDHHGLWRSSLAEPVMVSLGRGAGFLDILATPDSTPTEVNGELADLLASARSVENLALLGDARLGIGLIGAAAQTRAALNGIAVQLASALDPGLVAVRTSRHSALAWLGHLPHSRGEALQSRSAAVVEFLSSAGGGAVVISAGRTLSEIPRECGILIHFGAGGGSRIVRHPELGEGTAVEAEFVSASQACEYAEMLARSARAAGIAGSVAIPQRVDFCELENEHSGVAGTLACAIGVGERGREVVDLIADGPHALIGGTTGSGKSELLIAWVLAMADAFPVSAVNFLLVDFKGGASFRSVATLPHCVGIVTDLEPAGARRALESIGAELSRRERVLAARGASSIDAAPTVRPDEQIELPRLVIVVDEFATVSTRLPELHEVFVDIAARGRSLGVHLILCTQRPAGVVKDSVLANCSLRICLRVNAAADSVAMIGTAQATELRRKDAGRAILARGDEAPHPVQSALTSAADVTKVAGRWPKQEAVRPWCEPLPPHIGLTELDRFDDPNPSRGVAFAVADLPGEQRQEVLRYNQDVDRSVLIVGAHGSGKTGALTALASPQSQKGLGAVAWIPRDVEGAWDEVIRQLALVRSNAGEPRLLVLDDVDIVVGAFGDEHARIFMESLIALVREGGKSGVHLVVTTSRVTPSVQSLQDVCASLVLLRTANVHDHILAGGERTNFEPKLPAGAGFVDGKRVQILTVIPPAMALPEPASELRAEQQLVVVSGTPSAIAQSLNAVGEVRMVGELDSSGALAVSAGADTGSRVFLGDPEAWQSHWGLLATLRQRVPIALHNCTMAQFRMIARSQVTPPPLASPADTLWLLAPDGEVSRVRLPGQRGTGV